MGESPVDDGENQELYAIAYGVIEQGFPELDNGHLEGIFFRELEDDFTDYEITDWGYILLLDSDLEDADVDVLRGAIAEELALIVMRCYAFRGDLLVSDFLESISDRFSGYVARKQDDMVIQRGLGHALLAYNRFLESEFDYEFGRVDGYTPDELERRLQG